MKVQHTAKLSEKTVQKVARGEVKRTKRRGTRRVFNTRVHATNWTQGVDPRIVAKIREMKIAPARLEVKGPTEVIILNNPKANK